jgi:hypothetical protein
VSLQHALGLKSSRVARVSGLVAGLVHELRLVSYLTDAKEARKYVKGPTNVQESTRCETTKKCGGSYIPQFTFLEQEGEVSRVASCTFQNPFTAEACQ